MLAFLLISIWVQRKKPYIQKNTGLFVVKGKSEKNAILLNYIIFLQYMR